MSKSDNPDEAFFVNNSKTAWKTEKVSFLNPSRRFDIEFRNRYYNVYDAETDTYQIVCVQVPMLFVQEGYLDTLTKDVKSANGISVNVSVNTSELKLLMDQYDAYIPAFDEHKDAITIEVIDSMLGEPISLS